MSKIDDLMAPKKDVTFMGEKYSLDIGFTISESPAVELAFASKDPEIQAKGLGQLLKIIAKRLFPTASDDKLAKIDIKYARELINVFFQLNESTDKEKENIKKILGKE